MFKSQEVYSILAVIILVSLTIGLFRSINDLFYTFIAVFFVFSLNILAKKITSFYLDSEIEVRTWTLKRYGFSPQSYFKKALPLGIILPIVVAIISYGKLLWMSCLTFDVKPKTYRAAKRHGLYSYSEMGEDHIGLIATSGVLVNLFFAVIGYLIGFTEFSKLNIYLAFFSILPLSDLDGNKILFGNKVLWIFLATLTGIGLAYSFFMI
ncbi:hypothetical protein K0A97_02500 [Patescibacteria group bacterium]|nr:hypothetical protein [Patescibacteria group bacterium]